MGITFEQVNEVAHLSFDDEMTIYTAAEQKEELLKHFMASPELELDLSGVSEIDSAGLQLLIMLKNEGAKANKEVRFVHHSQSVVEVLELLNLATRFGDPIMIPTEWQTT
jgi:anti-anti-sigma factor